jgi:hypothetical protein
MRKLSYFCLPQAAVAQLVERNLAKVEVAGSSPVCRSRLSRRGGGIGRHAGLKILSPEKGGTGSSPVLGMHP